MYSKHPVPVVMAFIVAFWAGVSALVYGMLRLIAWVLLRLVAWVFEKLE